MAGDYTYVDETGTPQTIDIALVAGGFGALYVIDITDPYNPHVIGSLPDIYASDIAISATAGMAFASTWNGVIAIDIKNPKAPKVIGTVSGTGANAAIAEKGGWVYTANQNSGMKVVNYDPVYLEHSCADPEFGESVKIPCTDYYPALGAKTITLFGRDWTWVTPLKPPARIKFVGVSPTVPLAQPGEITVQTAGTATTCPGTNTPCGTVDNDGFARFTVQTSPTFTGSEINLEFEIDQTSITDVMNLIPDANNPQSHVAHVKLRLRNNANVTLDDVLKGTAVFTAYSIVSISTGTTKRFDYVQELLNQVVPRKRALTNPFDTGYAYALMDENGVYDFNSYNALVVFKDNFKLNVNDKVGPYPYSLNGEEDNTTATFRKLMKDYGKRQTGNMWLIGGTGYDSSDSWLYKVIDRETLEGTARRIPAITEAITEDNADVLINGATGNTRNDTGLYELYTNVVERFVNRVIAEAQTYANDNTAFRDRSNQTRNGVSYSFGGNKNLSQYQNAATNLTYAPNPYPNTTAFNNYRGNVGDIDPGKQYAGLLRDEQRAWNNHFNTNTACNQVRDHQFYPQYWAGIDCSGFVQRMINAADPEINQNNGIPPINILVDDLEAYAEICNNNGRYLQSRAWVSYFFDYFADDPITYIFNPTSGPERERLLRLLKKGDLIRYGDDHISIFYSQRWGESRLHTQWGTDYDIIHASGDNYVRYRVGTQTSPRMPNRKVIINSIGNALQSDTLTNPTEFGRIKLWN